jgi:two-component system, NarL family, response regulator LiaR
MSVENLIRVMIVDDHKIVRSGLGAFLLVFDDLELVAEADGGEQALEFCEQVQPDVVLMDLVMPGMDGVQATQIIRQRHPKVQVIALTSFKDHELVQRAMQAGAISYLLKDIDADELAKAIRAAYTGRPTLALEATQALIRASRREQPTTFDLTERQLEVLDLMISGLSNQEIASRLGVRESTVKYHVSSILSRFGASSRTEAVSLALRQRKDRT